MRSIVVFFLVANVAFYAYAAGYFDHARAADVARLGQQVKAETLKILAIDEERPAPAVGTMATVEPAPAPSAAAESPASTPPAAPDEKICLSWRLASGDADRLVHFLSERFPEFGLERHKVAASSSGWWVFIPMQAPKAEVERKRDELNRHGIHDHFVISEGKDRFAISLGVYATEKAGQSFLAILKGKGIDGARLGQRWSKEGLIQIDARGAAAQQGKVNEAVVQLLPDAKLQACQ